MRRRSSAMGLNHPMDSDDFADVLARARRGEELAWRRLFRIVSGRVVGFLVSRGVSDPEDIAGDTFMDIVKSIRRFEGSEENFVSWSLTIAHRRMVDARRKAARRRETVVEASDLDRADPTDVADVALGMVGAGAARRLLDQLTTEQADVVALRIYGELTLPEIAAELGKPLTAVKSLQHRGLERLRRLLAED